MAKLLRPLIVIVLLLSIGALVMGILLFNEREPLKGRADTHKEASIQLARLLAAEIDPHVSGIDERLDPEALLDYERMRPQLDLLRGIAQTRLDELVDTHSDLERTRNTLAQTERDLANTRDQLESARRRIDELEDSLAERTRQLAAANRRISGLEDDKSQLEDEIDTLQGRVAELEQEVERQTHEIEHLEYENSILRGPTDVVVDTPEGLHGEILHVEEEWNFVVINIGRDQRLALGTSMVVHRGDEYLGRIRVSSTERELSVGSIIIEQQKEPFQPGDRVFYTRRL